MNPKKKHVVTQVGFNPGTIGRCFYIKSDPSPALTGNPLIYIFPPFLEELNLVRRFITRLRIKLAELGNTVYLQDYIGTADSERCLGKVSWNDWINDSTSAISTLTKPGKRPLILMGVSSGCLLLDDLLQKTTPLLESDELLKIVYIHPEPGGEQYLNRFIRTKILADKLAGISTVSQREFENVLLQKGSIDIGGYEITLNFFENVCRQNYDQSKFVANIEKVCVQLSRQPNISWSNWKHVHFPISAPWQRYEWEPDPALLDCIATALHS